MEKNMTTHQQPRILILENDSTGEAARFYAYLEKNGVAYDPVEAYKHLPLPSPEPYSGVIATGGWMGVYEMDQPRYTYLQSQSAYLVEVVEREIPLLGVCLGHQLLAHALGGEAIKAETPELGWLSVTLTEEGLRDPLFEGFEQDPIFLQFHYDEVVKLPKGAVRLARSEITPNEAFRFGDRPAWGVQFHPEYPPEYAGEIFRKYRNQLERRGQDVEAMIARGYEVFGPKNDALFENFCNIVKSWR
jgi:GMP synthase-like glutamine amidotransferase